MSFSVQYSTVQYICKDHVLGSEYNQSSQTNCTEQYNSVKYSTHVKTMSSDQYTNSLYKQIVQYSTVKHGTVQYSTLNPLARE